MTPIYFIRFGALILLISSLFLSGTAYAANKSAKSNAEKVNVVIHVSNNIKSNFQAVLNYTYSLREH